MSNGIANVHMTPPCAASSKKYELLVIDNVTISGSMHIHIAVDLIYNFLGLRIGGPIVEILDSPPC